MNTVALCPVCRHHYTSTTVSKKVGMCGYCQRGLPSDSVLKPKQRSVKKEGK